MLPASRSSTPVKLRLAPVSWRDSVTLPVPTRASMLERALRVRANVHGACSVGCLCMGSVTAQALA